MKKNDPDPDERNRQVQPALRRFSILSLILWLAPFFAGALLVAKASAQSTEDGQQTLSHMAAQGPSNIYPIIALVLLAILYGLYTAIETALEQIRPVHLRQARDHDPDRAEILNDMVENRPQYVAASNVGSFSTLTLLIIMCMVIAPSVGALAENSGLFANYSALVGGAILVTLPVTVLTLVVGQIVPKSYAALHPVRTCLALRRFIKLSALVLGLPATFALSLANIITQRFGARASFLTENRREEEILSLVEDAQQSGEIENEEKELLESVFEFGETVAREIMTPRVDIDALPVSSPAEDLIKVIQESGHSRIPLFEDTDDQIVGIIHAKDVLRAMAKGDNIVLRRLMRAPLFVTENKNLHDLLREMRTSKTQMAVVQDEFGGTSGLLTIEDIVEELVGDIVDEYDTEQRSWTKEPDGSYIIDGKMHVDDVNVAIGGSIESDEFDTLGGYVFGIFGRQPKPEESVQDGENVYTVVATDGRRIKQIRVARLNPVST